MTRSQRVPGEFREARDRLPEGQRLAGAEAQMTLYEDIRQDGLYEKLVFVVGNARSATTVVAHILNMSERVYLMEEANLFIHLTKPDFPKWFNTKHRDEGKPPRKGTYVPPFEGKEETGLAALRRLAREYDFVGDKVAFNPFATTDGKSQQQYFFEQHAKFYSGCRYILTIRNPHESLLSMHRMFPSATLFELLRCWLESLRYSCICFTSFKRCRMIFHESIGTETFSAIGEFMGLELAVPQAYFDERLRRTSRAAGYDFGREHNAEIGTVLGGCEVLYRDVRHMFSPQTLLYQAPEPLFGLIGVTIDRVDQLQRALDEAAAEPAASSQS